MARVKLIEESEAVAEAKPFYANGYPGPIPASLAHVPDLMAAALPFLGRVLGPSDIDLRTKEVVILRASYKLGCNYCTQTHSVVALGAGLTPTQVAALRGGGPIEAVFTDPATRALVAWTDAIADGAAPVPSTALEALAGHYAAPQIVELTLVAAATIMLNRYATALDLPVAPAHLATLAEHGWA